MGLPPHNASSDAVNSLNPAAGINSGKNRGGDPGAETFIGLDAMAMPFNHPLSGGIQLPPLPAEAVASQRHEVPPALAFNLLRDIQAMVNQWQVQQRQIMQAMQTLYAQGPMVDGWLQSSLDLAKAEVPQSTDTYSTIFRHGDADALMQYVEALEGDKAASEALFEPFSAPAGAAEPSLAMPDYRGEPPTTGAHPNSQNTSQQSSQTQYQLCSLAEDGTVRSQVCPVEQMALVSSAIARYQKFKQLMGQKQAIEAKLQQAVEALTTVRSDLQQP
jgi:hypothetical protein